MPATTTRSVAAIGYTVAAPKNTNPRVGSTDDLVYGI